MKNNLVEFAKVYGPISGVLYGLPINEETIGNLLNSRIRDQRGEIVGRITDVDLDSDIWYGQVLKDSYIYKNVISNPNCSCEIRRME